jgi:hypothetical protein
MQPTEGLIATRAAVIACRAAVREGKRSEGSRFSFSDIDEWRWAPTRVVV